MTLGMCATLSCKSKPQMCVTELFEQYTGGVFVDATNCTSRDHDITLNGWGTDANGVDYWIGRNSWCVF